MSILEVRNLKKVYDNSEVVKGISFTVEKGEILGFLGPNGAGKSTTINILSTALKATEGEIKFNGENILKNKKRYKSSVGIVPQNLAIFENLPAIENVKYFASFYGIRGSELLDKIKTSNLIFLIYLYCVSYFAYFTKKHRYIEYIQYNDGYILEVISVYLDNYVIKSSSKFLRVKLEY